MPCKLKYTNVCIQTHTHTIISQQIPNRCVFESFSVYRRKRRRQISSNETHKEAPTCVMTRFKVNYEILKKTSTNVFYRYMYFPRRDMPKNTSDPAVCYVLVVPVEGPHDKPK